MVRFLRKQETINKKIMKLLKEMIELHNFNFELQTLANDLGSLKPQTPVIKF